MINVAMVEHALRKTGHQPSLALSRSPAVALPTGPAAPLLVAAKDPDFHLAYQQSRRIPRVKQQRIT